MTKDGVQDNQFNLNFTIIFFEKSNLKKLKKKIGSRFFSKLDTLYSIVLPMSVSKQSLLSQYSNPKKYLPFKVFISIW